MMVGRQNRPSCRLCQAQGAKKLPAVRIGVWICKRHWRGIIAFVNQPDYMRGYEASEVGAAIRELND